MRTLIMKTIVIILIFFVEVSIYGQNSSLCDKETIIGKKENIKKEVEKYTKKYKTSVDITDTLKENIKNEYTYLQEEHNKIYKEIKKDIESGWSFVGEGRLCKTKYYYRLVELEKETNKFLTKHKTSESNKKSTKIDLFPIIITGLEKLAEYLEGKAKDKAEVFFEKFAWKTYEEL